MPLYRELLQSDFERLPDKLRRFHEFPGGGQATGNFEIVRGSSLIARMIATLQRLPHSGTDVPLKLKIVVAGNCECWVRDFDGRCLHSTQSKRNGWLIEKAGLGQFGFDLVVDEQGLRFESKRF